MNKKKVEFYKGCFRVNSDTYVEILVRTPNKEKILSELRKIKVEELGLDDLINVLEDKFYSLVATSQDDEDIVLRSIFRKGSNGETLLYGTRF